MVATIIKPGDTVVWKWAGSIAYGKVKEVNYEHTTIESRGSIVTRNGSDINPAVLIEHKSGSKVLKLASELEIAKYPDQ